MKLIILFSILVLICSCTSRGYFNSPQTQVIDQIIQKNNRNLREIGIYECMNGGSGYPLTSTISEGYITYQYRFESVEKARLLFYKLASELLNSLNKNDSVGALVEKFPLTADSLDLSIFFLDENRKALPPSFISVVKMKNGTISFYSEDLSGNWNLIHSEKYEDAKKIIDSQRSS